MKCLLFLASLVVLGWNCNAETQSQNASHPYIPGLCVFEGEEFPPGEHRIPGTCMKITCSQRGWLSIHSCIPLPEKEFCTVGPPIDVDAPFPECCKKKYVCKKKPWLPEYFETSGIWEGQNPPEKNNE